MRCAVGDRRQGVVADAQLRGERLGERRAWGAAAEKAAQNATKEQRKCGQARLSGPSQARDRTRAQGGARAGVSEWRATHVEGRKNASGAARAEGSTARTQLHRKEEAPGKRPRGAPHAQEHAPTRNNRQQTSSEKNPNPPASRGGAMRSTPSTRGEARAQRASSSGHSSFATVCSQLDCRQTASPFAQLPPGSAAHTHPRPAPPPRCRPRRRRYHLVHHRVPHRPPLHARQRHPGATTGPSPPRRLSRRRPWRLSRRPPQRARAPPGTLANLLAASDDSTQPLRWPGSQSASLRGRCSAQDCHIQQSFRPQQTARKRLPTLSHVLGLLCGLFDLMRDRNNCQWP